MGMPHEGLGITGYGNFKKRYVSFWIDNHGTAMSTSTGTYDPATKAFTFEGLMDEPMTEEKDKKVRYVHKVVDNDRHFFEIHDPIYPEGKTRVAEIACTRRAAAKR